MTITVRQQLGPAETSFHHLGMRILELESGDSIQIHETDRESAVVVVTGSISVRAPALHHRIRRASPFSSMGEVVYVPPATGVAIHAHCASEVAIGTAPADGLYPLRIVTPVEMSTELRGGGPAYRQVTAPLAHPIPAERLIVYEAYIPRGTWSGWPPHRHDGEDNSPYLEETYYFHFDRPSGYGFHRNYAGDDFDQHFLLRDGSLVAVPRGYHVCAAAPAANMWILNFLAGDPEDRTRPPVFDQNETWITADWDSGRMTLPAVTAT